MTSPTRPGRAVATCRVVALGLAITIGLGLAGCASTPATGRQRIVTVFAAASLTDVFGVLVTEFESANPGVNVVVNYAGSSTLAEQLLQGAPADIFASASEETMATVVEAGLAERSTVFATNTLQIAVPAGNPGGVVGLADFARPELVIALCAAEAPCGSAAARVFAAAGLVPAPDTLEPDVRAVFARVLLGEADAGLVYRTDVLAAVAAGAAIHGIDIDAGDADAASTRYPIAALEAAGPAAAEFVAFVRGPSGARALKEAGFGTR